MLCLAFDFIQQFTTHIDLYEAYEQQLSPFYISLLTHWLELTQQKRRPVISYPKLTLFFRLFLSMYIFIRNLEARYLQVGYQLDVNHNRQTILRLNLAKVLVMEKPLKLDHACQFFQCRPVCRACQSQSSFPHGTFNIIHSAFIYIGNLKGTPLPSW